MYQISYKEMERTTNIRIKLIALFKFKPSG